jgi:FdhD protein
VRNSALDAIILRIAKLLLGLVSPKPNLAAFSGILPEEMDILVPMNNDHPFASATVQRERTTSEASVSRFVGGEEHVTTDFLAVEEPLEIQLAHGPSDSRKVKPISVTMRTPGHDFELVAGFLLTEGIVSDTSDISKISYVAGSSNDLRSPSASREKLILPYQPERNVVRVELVPEAAVSMPNLERNFYTTSSCGICGKASLLALRSVCPPRTNNSLSVSASLLYSLPDCLRSGQDVFKRTGGLHASGLFDSEGHLHAIREDVGRHNAVDKLIGAEFLADRLPLRDRILLLSGRASFELLQKALMAGISMVVSVGAPSSLAVQVAKEFDITLVGFLRCDHFNVYQGAGRISGSVANRGGT